MGALQESYKTATVIAERRQGSYIALSINGEAINTSALRMAMDRLDLDDIDPVTLALHEIYTEILSLDTGTARIERKVDYSPQVQSALGLNL